MRVLFVSQCTKNAIAETRRIIDQFAERKGDSVWETSITEQGLETVRKLLKSTARRNTAVSCHLFKGRLQTELLWIVGNPRKFNREGNVPTNITTRDILREGDENNWCTGEAIGILAALAGLFHDFGKANILFQNKLRKKKQKSYEPFRHEWVSLQLFKQFVGGSSDQEWLERLLNITPKEEIPSLKEFPNMIPALKINPLKDLRGIARFVGWLILSHHRMPVYDKNGSDDPPRLDGDIDRWMLGKRFCASWNSTRCDDAEWSEKDNKHVWLFPEGTPIKSKSWCIAAKRIATHALHSHHLLNRDWFKDRFSMHLARMSLMLSDHIYSAGTVHAEYQDPGYPAYANTTPDKKLKQKLDEHNIGVARQAYFIAKSIPKLRETLPFITRDKHFKKRSADVRFGWQNRAFDLATSIKYETEDNGFFGLNLASTGCGKTLANARIMYGLSDEKKGCRFSIALGLRVLTLQTGESLREKLFLKNDELAVVIGSKAVQELHEHKNKSALKPNQANDAASAHYDEELCGSESLAGLTDDDHVVHYDGNLDDGRLKRWFKSAPEQHKLVSAPILVSTIDHLISATEGCRGGKQIAPILRLLTSDLVLDEPDDFDVADLPALCRLVNFAGVFGSRVLLSSATLPPALVKALFEAYAAGRKSYNEICGKTNNAAAITCAWFDEFEVASSTHQNADSYINSHCEFVDKRIAQLEQLPVLRRGKLVSVGARTTNPEDAKKSFSNAIKQSMYQLHDNHHQIHPNSGKKVSIGLVRMANIDPMVSVVKMFLKEEAKKDYCIHFCVYHSRFPMLIRSKIEEVLDATLSRQDPNKLWEVPEIESALTEKAETNHIFVVFATSVAEVGRDHDYDWAIAEPSSMRSIIQLAGRVQRHRKVPPSESNIVILQNNLKGLKGSDLAYTRPGFESKDFSLIEKDLSVSLQPFQYEKITSIPRLQSTDQVNFSENLVALEHKRLKAVLQGISPNKFYAGMWWKYNADWCGEFQRISRFREPEGIDKEYFYYLEEDGQDPIIHEWPKNGSITPVETMHFKSEELEWSNGFYPWINCDVKREIYNLSKITESNLKEVSLKFSKFRLRELNPGERWCNNSILGFYQK